MWTLLALASGFVAPLPRPAQGPNFAPAAPVGGPFPRPAPLEVAGLVPPQAFVEQDLVPAGAIRGRGISLSRTLSCLLLTASAALALGPARRRPARARGARMGSGEEEVLSEEEFAALEAAEGQKKDEFFENLPDRRGGDLSGLSPEAQKIAKTLKLKSGSGADLVPWMNDTDFEKIAQAKKDREERKNRQTESRVDTMNLDPQASEQSGTGSLNSKVLSEEEVELRWSTEGEEGNAGFIVQRRPGGQNAFTDVATFETAAQLRTKGPQGGDYVYLDDTVAPGTWVYRIVDVDTSGQKSAISQKLVEIESNSEQTQQLIVGIFFFGLAIAGVVGGIVLDPLQTTDRGAVFF